MTLRLFSELDVMYFVWTSPLFFFEQHFLNILYPLILPLLQDVCLALLAKIRLPL